MEVLKELFDRQKGLLDDFFSKVSLQSLEQVVRRILSCGGSIHLTGVGKSGLIAQKIAVTLSSTGTRSLFLEPTNLLHGDLGMVSVGDMVLLLSKSGESDELLHVIPYLRNKGAETVAVVCNSQSRLSRACQHTVYLPLERELCPFDLAPTTSTIVQLIFGDILAVWLMREREFTLDQYALNHPSGRIGKRITLRVKDLMIKGDNIPFCSPDDCLMDVLVTLSDKRCGCVLAVGERKELLGIFTDGDLRRALQNHAVDVMRQKISSLMNPGPKTISPETLAWHAMQKMEEDQAHPVMVLPVIEGGCVVGLIKMHDILQSGL